MWRTASTHRAVTAPADRASSLTPLEITMRTIRRSPASARWASTRPTVTLAGRRRSALIVTLNLAVAAIYLVHIGHGIGLGGGRVDLEVYRAGAAVELHGGDLYGQLPRLGDGRELPFAALSFISLAILGYSTANCLLTVGSIACVAASLRRFAASTPGEAGARMRQLLPWAGLSFAACTGAGSALAPHDSLRYWTQVAYQPARIGGLAFASDQSILGTLARLGLVCPARIWLWL